MAPAGSHFDRLVHVAGTHEDLSLENTEIRSFLALAYSLLDDQIVEQGKAYWSSWSWAQYLAALGPQLQVIVSFNYDLVIEHLLEVLGIGFRRVGFQDECGELVIHKPHGSIDYGPAGLFIPTAWPATEPTLLVDTELEFLDRAERTAARKHVELVPPNQASLIESFHWVEQGYMEFEERAATCEQCIILGHSYGEVDRTEIDRLLNFLPQSTRVIIADRAPSEALVQTVEDLGLEVECWSDGEPPDQPRADVTYPAGGLTESTARFVPPAHGPIAAIAGAPPVLDNVSILGYPPRLRPCPRGAAPHTEKPDPPMVGRNDPCWCGSGTKFKKCHGR